MSNKAILVHVLSLHLLLLLFLFLLLLLLLILLLLMLLFLFLFLLPIPISISISLSISSPIPIPIPITIPIPIPILKTYLRYLIICPLWKRCFVKVVWHAGWHVTNSSIGLLPIFSTSKTYKDTMVTITNVMSTTFTNMSMCHSYIAQILTNRANV